MSDKEMAGDPGTEPATRPATRDRPRDRATEPPGPDPVGYRDLVSEVGRRTGLDFDRARRAAEASVTVLARALPDPDRRRLLNAVPAELHENFAVEVPYHPDDMARFLGEVARIAHATPEQARLQAQAVLGALVVHDGELIGSLDLPPDLRDLVEPAPPRGRPVPPSNPPAGPTPSSAG
jgi:uncharacterized protein (DUF2267 family)